MADTCTCFNHRHLAIRYNLFDKSRTATRNDYIYVIPQLQHHIHCLPVRLLNQLNSALRYAGMICRLCHDTCNGLVRDNRLGASTQDNSVAGFQAKANGIGRNIWPGFINHAHNAERHPDATNFQPVGTYIGVILRPDRVRQGGSLAKTVSHTGHPAFIQHQPVQKRPLYTFFASLFQIYGICLQNGTAPLLQSMCHSQQGIIFRNRRKCIHLAGRIFCRLRLTDNLFL